MIFCLVACALGALLAAITPVGLFALGLLAVGVAHALAALMAGTGLAAALVWSLALIGCGQIGYVVGIAVLAWFRHRRDRIGRERPTVERRSSLHDPFL